MFYAGVLRFPKKNLVDLRVRHFPNAEWTLRLPVCGYVAPSAVFLNVLLFFQNRGELSMPSWSCWLDLSEAVPASLSSHASAGHGDGDLKEEINSKLGHAQLNASIKPLGQ